MIRRSLIFSLCFLLSPSAGGSLRAIPFSMIAPGDPLLEDIRLLVRESGASFRSFTPPLSRDELLLILDEIDGETLEPPLRDLYDRAYAALSPPLRYAEGLFGLEARVVATPALRLRTNADIPFGKPDTTSPLALAFPLAVYLADTAELTITPSMSADPLFYGEQGSHVGVNIPYEARRFDLNMPLRAFVAAGGPWWNVQLGRDKVSYGLGHTGNLALSATPDYYDFARFSLFSRNFKYSALVSHMPLNLEDPQILSEERRDAAAGAGALLNTTQRYLYLHRIDARFFRKVSLGVSEALMAGNAAPELRYLSPLIVLHNAWPWRDYQEWGTGAKGYMTGSLFSLDIDWAILPSLALYGQFVLNEFSTPYELENYPGDQPPNGLGYLAGIERSQVLAGWKALAYGEFVYADPYLYTLSSPFASYVWMRRLSEVGAKPLRYRWIGHGEGRDMALFALGASVSKADLALSADVSLVNRGEHTIAWDWAQDEKALGERAPTGTVERRLSVGAGAAWRPLAWLSLSGYAAWALLLNAGHRADATETGLELYLSVALSY
jgi:hypothetical protein